jgi:hypothetical protein
MGGICTQDHQNFHTKLCDLCPKKEIAHLSNLDFNIDGASNCVKKKGNIEEVRASA